MPTGYTAVLIDKKPVGTKQFAIDQWSPMVADPVCVEAAYHQ